MADKPVTISVSCHAWNADQTKIALSPNSTEVWIYSVDSSNKEDTTKWTKTHTLTEHGGYVSMIDWCPSTNMLVTSGHDRNAYVWTYTADTDVWSPTLVILRINRAATAVKWSPLGNKFAVASGAKCVPICHFEDSNNWWISKMIKKHKSTVLSLDWCMNNKFVVTGSTDFKCRIFSAFVEGLDSPEDDGFGSVFPKAHAFGECLAEFDQAKAWVNAVAWSPSGYRLAFAGHGSTMHFVQIVAGAKPLVQTVHIKALPHMCIGFLSDNTVVACGFDQNPTLYSCDSDAPDSEWSEVEKVDKENSAGSDKKEVKKNAFSSAKNMFLASDREGRSFGNKAKKVEVKTRHKAAITSLSIFPSNTEFTTAGEDGRVLFWDLVKAGIEIK